LNDNFVRSTTDLEKTVNMNFLFVSLSVITIADAFLHKGNVWAMINDPLYDAIHEKTFLFQLLCRNIHPIAAWVRQRFYMARLKFYFRSEKVLVLQL